MITFNIYNIDILVQTIYQRASWPRWWATVQSKYNVMEIINPMYILGPIKLNFLKIK